MIDSKIFTELQESGIITHIGLKAEDFNNLEELKEYGFATSMSTDEVYSKITDKLKYEENFISMIATGGDIVVPCDLTLDAPLVISKDTTIDLNGCTISSTQDVFEVTGGKLTINGNGRVYAATDNTCSWCAVFAHGNSVVEINGGEYKIGAPAGDYNDLIYAKDNAVITINSGKFYIDGTVRANDEVSFMLNLKDKSAAKIEVKGGMFEKANPAVSKTEIGGDYSFVADGFESVAEEDWFVVKPANDIVVEEVAE